MIGYVEEFLYIKALISNLVPNYNPQHVLSAIYLKKKNLGYSQCDCHYSAPRGCHWALKDLHRCILHLDNAVNLDRFILQELY